MFSEINIPKSQDRAKHCRFFNPAAFAVIQLGEYLETLIYQGFTKVNLVYNQVYHWLGGAKSFQQSKI